MILALMSSIPLPTARLKTKLHKKDTNNNKSGK